MADDSQLLSSADLLNFSNSAAGANTLGMVGNSLNAWTPDMRTWDGATQGITAFGKSFLAGLLQNQARADASNQLQSVVNVLPQLREDPTAVAIPEGVDPASFNTLKGTAILKNEALKTAKASALADLFQKMKIAGMTKKEEILQANEANNEIAKAGGIENTDSPGYKANQDRLTAERALANDFLGQTAKFKLKEEGLKALTEAYKDPSGTSDYEIIRRGAQSVEPGLAVRLDDQESLQGAASALGMTVAAVKSALTGDTKLTDDVRAGILRIAKRSYNASLGDYNTLRDNFLTRAEQGKLNKNSVVPWGAAKPFESLYPDIKIDIGASAPINLNSRIDEILAKKGYAPDGTPLRAPLPTQPLIPGN